PGNTPRKQPRAAGLSLRVLELFMPGHLDGFKPRLVRLCRVVGKTFQFGDVAMQIGEADRQRVQTGKFLSQLNADLLGVGPQNLARHRVDLLTFLPPKPAACLRSRSCGSTWE